jgi:hypothetical protein
MMTKNPIPKERFLEIIQQFRDCAIAGMVTCADEFVYGEISRLWRGARARLYYRIVHRSRGCGQCHQ